MRLLTVSICFALLMTLTWNAMAQGSFGRSEGRGTLQRLDRIQPGQVDPGPLVEQHNIPGLTISNLGSISTNAAGEVVAAVVPPGKKLACPAGRLLVSLDGVKEPNGGAIRGRNLLNLHGTTIHAKLTGYVNTATVDGKTIVVRRVKSNNQDLGVLPNGDVLYVRMAQSRVPLISEPGWFDFAYKITDNEPPWGPGARSEILVFRSQDCGGTFQLVSTIDTAKLLNGLAGFVLWDGGLPQRCDTCPVPLRNGRSVWNMAGTDGPTLKIDPASGAAYLSVGFFGYYRDPDASGFTLSEDRIKRTVVLRSVNGGQTWPRSAVLGFSAWRQEMITFANDHVVVGAGRSFRRLRNNNVGSDGLTQLEGDIVTVPGPPVVWTGYSGDLASNHFGGLRGQTMSSRLPGGESALLMIRDTADGSSGGPKGYRAYSYDWSDPGYFLEYIPAIAPEREGRSNFIHNPVLVDAGDGPILAYWYDVTTDNQDPDRHQWAKIKGRLFLGRHEFTPDFTIRSLFPVTADQFFGHYHVAGGYHTVSSLGDRRTTFFPVWIEPDGNVHFAQSPIQKFMRDSSMLPVCGSSF